MKAIRSISFILLLTLIFSLCSAAAFAESGPLGEPNTGERNDDGKVYCYKSPYNESIGLDGEANFICKAENYTDCTWYIGTADGANKYTLEEAADKYDQIELFYRYNKSEVTIRHVPLEMNGWLVQVQFEGDGGPVISKPASIKINEKWGDQYWNQHWSDMWKSYKGDFVQWWYVYDEY